MVLFIYIKKITKEDKTILIVIKSQDGDYRGNSD